MNAGAVIKDWRDQTKQKSIPYLIDESEAFSYLNEAQMEAARRSRLLIDSTTPGIAQVDVSAGSPVVDIDSRIISIRRIRLASSSRPLTKRTVRQMDEQFPGWDTATTVSQPFVVVTDYQSDALFLYPSPKADDVLLMTVSREPVFQIEDSDDDLEISPRYVGGLVDWMKYRTYMNEDTDLFNEKKAAVALASFESEFGPAVGAINERFEFEHYDDVGER